MKKLELVTSTAEAADISKVAADKALQGCLQAIAE